MSSQVRRGDYIRLKEGEERYVQDVTWRYTTITQLGGNLTIVPNAKLASAITSNYNRPATEQAVLVDVTVSYDADLALVEHAAEDVAREVMREVPGGVAQFRPFVRYGSLSDVGVKFSVIMQGTDYVAQYLVTHEFIKRLHRRFRDDGIEFARLPRPVGVPPAEAVPSRHSATGNGRALAQQDR